MAAAGSYFDALRKKWQTIPFTADDRVSSRDLLALSDADLFQQWDQSRHINVEGSRLNYLRGWYQLLYRDWCSGRKIIDIGCGLGIDGIHFAENGAQVTFIDLIESNVDLVRRICRIKGIEPSCEFLVMKNPIDLAALPTGYDAVMGFGSLMNAPLEVMKPEFDQLAARLKPDGGRFIMHAYPKARWIREGSLPFDQWGEKTDGEGTPWAEWYDPGKLIDALKPARFELVFYTEYRQGDMNCIDLIRSTGPEQRPPSSAIRLAESPRLSDAATFWEGVTLEHVPGGGIHVTTGPACWSYAVQIPFSAAPAGRPVRLHVKARVEEGEIGIGIVTNAPERFLIELRFDQQSDAGQLSAEIRLDDVRAVIIRNACRDNRPSKVFVEDVALYNA